MSAPCWRGCRRDLIVGGLSALLTAVALVPIALASQRSGNEQVEAARRETQAALLRAEQKSIEADQQRALAKRALVEQAADKIGFGEGTEAEALRVTTDAVSPEVPKEAGW